MRPHGSTGTLLAYTLEPSRQNHDVYIARLWAVPTRCRRFSQHTEPDTASRCSKSPPLPRGNDGLESTLWHRALSAAMILAQLGAGGDAIAHHEEVEALLAVLLVDG